MVCFRNIFINTLHEGDNVDDDDDNDDNNNNNNRVAAILYSLGTWFVSGIYA
jgi:hypothetical protein